MAKKIDKMGKTVHDSFTDKLKEAFKEKFNLDLETTFSIISMTLISRREDGKDFTHEQLDFIQAFEAGYLAAMNQIHE